MDLFPFDEVRHVQKEFMRDLKKALLHKRDFIAHAPTGLGKTAAALTPLLEEAIEKDLTIFFLTSRHTQHEIVMRTIRAINEKHQAGIVATSLISKKWMCSQGGAQNMSSGDFASFCQTLKENDECAYFTNARKKNYYPTLETAKTVKDLKVQSPVSSQLIFQYSEEKQLCPYEVALVLAHSARVIVCDYFYLFSPNIREGFLAKLGKKLEECILVVDEGHNLPDRARDLYTERITSFSMRRAIKEARDSDAQLALQHAVAIQDALTTLAGDMQPGQEKMIKTHDFIELLQRSAPLETIAQTLELAALDVRLEKKSSSLGAIARFLENWREGEKGMCRILSMQSWRGEPNIQLSKRCLDPSLLTAPVIDQAHITVLMSGTLVPTQMYREILGFKEDTQEHEYESPFPDENRLSLIIPQTTTKFTMRSPEQYDAIARICAEIAEQTPGCSAFFFPSYAVLGSVLEYFNPLCTKTTFTEVRGMNKDEKESMLKRFAQYKETGAVLFGVAAGSFGEGVDLPGVLRSVVVVGLPLDRPDLETKELITYYNEKFGRGVDYGYILPALRRTLQNAGRCIRTEKDQGALIFLDERYAWPLYRRCFPQDWNMYVSERYREILEQFF